MEARGGVDQQVAGERKARAELVAASVQAVEVTAQLVRRTALHQPLRQPPR